MDIIRKCSYISNSYYNKGLRFANEKNISAAVPELKKSLEYNKNNTDARNLLGLLYFHIGEVSDALVQWVISLNIQPQNNSANRYLDELQRQSGVMDAYDSTIQKFNQCLSLAKSGSEDLAIIQLNKIVSRHNDYLKAWVLLGLLYSNIQDYPKAYRAFHNALRIDHGHPLSLDCIEFLKQQKSKESKSKKSIKEVFSPSRKKEQGTDSIVIEPYRENNGLGTVANILVGALIGVAAVAFIYLPAAKKHISENYNTQMIAVSSSLNSANNEIHSLENQAKEMQEEINKLKSERETIDDVYLKKLSAYEKVAGCMYFLENDDLKSAAELYSEIDPVEIEGSDQEETATIKTCYDEISSMMNDTGYLTLMKSGDKAFESEDFDTAMEYYVLSYAVHDTNPASLYKQGLCLWKKGDKESANEIFTRVIEGYPDSPVAELAKGDRGY